jgi:integration host factor subunit alpha
MSEPFLSTFHDHGESADTEVRFSGKALNEIGARLSGFSRTVTRADLLDAICSASPSLSRSEAREIFEMFLQDVGGSLTRGESVSLRAFGLFTVRDKRERIGRNPRTGESASICPRRVLKFKASPVLIDKINGGHGAVNDD